MDTPKKAPPTPTQSDDHLYVSPTSDDTLKERYKKVRAREAQLTNEERLKAIRTPSPLFPDNLMRK